MFDQLNCLVDGWIIQEEMIIQIACSLRRHFAVFGCPDFRVAEGVAGKRSARTTGKEAGQERDE